MSRDQIGLYSVNKVWPTPSKSGLVFGSSRVLVEQIKDHGALTFSLRTRDQGKKGRADSSVQRAERHYHPKSRPRYS